MPAPSLANTEPVTTGQKLTDILEVLTDLRLVVYEARLRPFTTQSDFARGSALAVALAASLGYISTLQDSRNFGNRWMITNRGMKFMDRGWYV